MTVRRFRRPPEPPVGHSHRLPSWLIGSILIIGLGLLAGVVIVAKQNLATNDRLTQLEQYVAGKGDQRDAENARQNERINEAVCRVLDQLPAGRLDVVRDQYGCGPGMAAESTTPAPSPTAPTGTTPSPAGGAAAPGPPAEPGDSDVPPDAAQPGPAEPPAPPPAAAGSPPASSPGPAPRPTPAAPERGPVIDLLCGLLPLCSPTEGEP